MSPRVSVVLPAYNALPFLQEAVESILNQSLHDLELVVVDDGSTDGSSEVLAGYAARDRRVLLLRNPSNLGLIPTLNRGVAAATGRYVARQDADDVSLPHRLARQADWLDDHPDVGVLATDYWRLFPDGTRSLRRPPREHTALRFRFLFGNVWCHASVMLRRRLLDELDEPPYRPEFRHVEDYDLWTRLLRSSRGATLPEPLVIYRSYDEGVCGRHGTEQATRTWEIAAREMKRLAPELNLGPQAAEELARARRDPAPRASTAQTTRQILGLLHALSHEPDARASSVRRLRRRWVGRLVGSHPADRLLELARSTGPALLRRAPGALVPALLLYPYRRSRRLAGRLHRGLRRRGLGPGLLYLVQRLVRLLPGRRPRQREVTVAGTRLLARSYAGREVLFTPGTSLMDRLQDAQAIYEPELVEALRRELERRDADRFLDIGANIGLITLAVLASAPDLRVDAFEPSPHPAELLAATLRHNRLGGVVRLHRCALSESDGTAEFWVHHPAHASGDGLRDTGRAGEADCIRVPTRTLDSWWQEAGEPAIPVVKIDTEGAELPILRGAVSFLASCRPTLFLEIHERNLRAYEHSERDLLSWLHDHGYSLSALDGRAVNAESLASLPELGETFVARPVDERERE